MTSKKPCKRCGKTLPLEDFVKNKYNKDGRTNRCRPCDAQYAKEWRQANPEKWAAILARNEERRKNGPNRLAYKEQARIANWRKKYGLSPEQVLALGERCNICESTDRLHVDHNHVTGRVRGRLCQECNWGLGRFKDNPDLLAAAIVYLGRHL